MMGINIVININITKYVVCLYSFSGLSFKLLLERQEEIK
jgi:hypothetical protein